MTTQTAALAFREYAIDGNPGSGQHEPLKSDLREYFGALESGEFGNFVAVNAPAWSPTVTYSAMRSHVRRGGMLFLALVDNINKDPLTSSEWQQILGAVGGTLADKQTLPASSATEAGFNIGPAGVAPTAKVNGDVYRVGNDWFFWDGTSVKQFMFGNGAMPVGSIVDVKRNVDAVARTFTGGTAVPSDNTAPLITEGHALLSQAFTPKAATNLLDVDAVVQIGKTAAGFYNAEIFDGNTLIGATYGYAPAAFAQASLVLKVPLYAAGSTTLRTFTVRVGQPTTSETITVNGNSTVTFGGSAHYSSLTIREIVA